MPENVNSDNFAQIYVHSLLYGEFTSKKAFYEHYGVKESTFYKWLRTKKDEIDKELDEAKSVFRQLAFQALQRKFGKSDVEMDAIKTALKISGDLIERREDKINAQIGIIIKDLTHDDVENG